MKHVAAAIALVVVVVGVLVRQYVHSGDELLRIARSAPVPDGAVLSRQQADRGGIDSEPMVELDDSCPPACLGRRPAPQDWSWTGPLGP